MKNLIIIFISILSLSSCKAQKNTPIMQLDIETFERKTYYTADSTYIQQFKSGEGVYVKKIGKKDSLYLDYHEYNKDGKLIKKGKSIRNGSGVLGKRYEYDEKGNITKVTDYDFTFTLDSLQAYAKRNEIDLLKTRILKGGNEWELRYIGKYRDISGGFKITIDGKTGEELLVTQYNGMYEMKGTTNMFSKYDTIYYKGQPYKQK